MILLGIETSCDECSLALVEDGKRILGQVIATQIEHHKPYDGVVPELASRLHAQWITPVYRECITQAGLSSSKIDGVAVTAKPGLVGSLLVGVNFAKGLAFGLDRPLIGVDHILAHLYAPQLEADIPYPFLGLLVSGGHSLIVQVQDFDQVEVLGASTDDAVGEAFDKVAKFYGLGYPGGRVIDELSQKGNSSAYKFPLGKVKNAGPYDLTYSGLKTAVLHQSHQFLQPGYEPSLPNLCASFQKAAVDALILRLTEASKVTGLTRVVAGGGVAANSYLRQTLSSKSGWEVFYPSLSLCTDNGAMVAGIGYHYYTKGLTSGWDLNAESRVPRFKRIPGPTGPKVPG